MTGHEMAGWHHRLDGHEFEQASGIDDGQGSLACCSPWGFKELDMTEQLHNNNNEFLSCKVNHPHMLCDPQILFHIKF